jgi:hypothetical protein
MTARLLVPGKTRGHRPRLQRTVLLKLALLAGFRQ